VLPRDVWMGGEIRMHHTAARGHLRANVDHEARIGFDGDEPGDVVPHGRCECDGEPLVGDGQDEAPARAAVSACGRTRQSM
jgi:hypothetical protein